MNVEPVSEADEVGSLAMFDLPKGSEREIVCGGEPLIYGGTGPRGEATIHIDVPPGSPVNMGRLWTRIAATVAGECVAVGIPLEGETVEGFVALLEERGWPATETTASALSATSGNSEIVVRPVGTFRVILHVPEERLHRHNVVDTMTRWVERAMRRNGDTQTAEVEVRSAQIAEDFVRNRISIEGRARFVWRGQHDGLPEVLLTKADKIEWPVRL